MFDLGGRACSSARNDGILFALGSIPGWRVLELDTIHPMMIIYFFYGLSFGGLGLAAYLQLNRAGELPLKKELPWLAAFGLSCGATAWVDMFLASGNITELHSLLTVLRIILQPLTGLLLFVFGWGTLTSVGPLPSWTVFIPGVLIVPIAYVIAYASTTFVTPSPIEIPIDIWSRYLLYLPGSFMAGAGFVRQWYAQRQLGLQDVSRLMLGCGTGLFVRGFCRRAGGPGGAPRTGVLLQL